MTPDGRRVIAGIPTEEAVHMWNLKTGRKIRTFEGHTPFVMFVLAVTPDGKFLITSMSDNALSVWNIAGGIEQYRLQNSDADLTFGKLVVTPNSRYLLSTLGDTLKVWDLVTKQVVCKFRADSAISACAVAPDGTNIVVGDTSGQVSFLQLKGLEGSSSPFKQPNRQGRNKFGRLLNIFNRFLGK